jgi:hypothetical protein
MLQQQQKSRWCLKDEVALQRKKKCGALKTYDNLRDCQDRCVGAVSRKVICGIIYLIAISFSLKVLEQTVLLSWISVVLVVFIFYLAKKK